MISLSFVFTIKPYGATRSRLTYESSEIALLSLLKTSIDESDLGVIEEIVKNDSMKRLGLDLNDLNKNWEFSYEPRDDKGDLLDDGFGDYKENSGILFYVMMNRIHERNPEEVSKKLKIVKLLIEAGADVNVENRSREYIENLICRYSDPYATEVINSLIVKGDIDINRLSGYENITPLSAAASANNSAMVGFLLKNGADASIPDISGRTAIEYSSNPEIRNLLMPEPRLRSYVATNLSKAKYSDFL